MKIALIVPGGVDRSGRERVVPVLLWLIERLARRHSLHVFVLDYYTEPCTYQLFGATIHDPVASPIRRADNRRRPARNGTAAARSIRRRTHTGECLRRRRHGGCGTGARASRCHAVER
jgi:hypothetical protein